MSVSEKGGEGETWAGNLLIIFLGVCMTSFAAKFYLKIQVAYAGSMDKLHHLVVSNFFIYSDNGPS